jgi:hypothetical protein
MGIFGVNIPQAWCVQKDAVAQSVIVRKIKGLGAKRVRWNGTNSLGSAYPIAEEAALAGRFIDAGVRPVICLNNWNAVVDSFVTPQALESLTTRFGSAMHARAAIVAWVKAHPESSYKARLRDEAAAIRRAMPQGTIASSANGRETDSQIPWWQPWAPWLPSTQAFMRQAMPQLPMVMLTESIVKDNASKHDNDLRAIWGTDWIANGTFCYWGERIEEDLSPIVVEYGVSYYRYADRGRSLISMTESLLAKGVREMYLFSLGDPRFYGQGNYAWWQSRREYKVFLDAQTIALGRPIGYTEFDAILATDPNAELNVKYLAFRVNNASE